MWTSDAAHTGSTVQYQLREDGALMSWRDVVRSWRDPEFADWFSELLASSDWPAFFWECPPVTRSLLDEPFEFVLVDSRGLAVVAADPGPFGDQFVAGSLAVSFYNLGRDAYLVAPCPGPASSSCAHLAAFVRGASPSENQVLWSSVADALDRELDDRQLWVSTSGLGVYWVHIRLDRRPKYYTHPPYRWGQV